MEGKSCSFSIEALYLLCSSSGFHPASHHFLDIYQEEQGKTSSSIDALAIQHAEKLL